MGACLMDTTLATRLNQPEPFFREAGTGPGVVCIHSNASTSGQWRGLMDLLAPKFRELVEFENLGHMGPVTHPDPVNELIEQFLERAQL